MQIFAVLVSFFLIYWPFVAFTDENRLAWMKWGWLWLVYNSIGLSNTLLESSWEWTLCDFCFFWSSQDLLLSHQGDCLPTRFFFWGGSFFLKLDLDSLCGHPSEYCILLPKNTIVPAFMSYFCIESFTWNSLHPMMIPLTPSNSISLSQILGKHSIGG